MHSLGIAGVCAMVGGASIRWLSTRFSFSAREWIPCRPLLVDPLRTFLSLAVAVTYGWLVLPLTRSPSTEGLDLGCALLGGWLLAGGLGTWLARWVWRSFPSVEVQIVAPSTLNVRAGARELCFDLRACTLSVVRVTTLARYGQPWFTRYALEQGKEAFVLHVQDAPDIAELLGNPEVRVSWIGPAAFERGPEVAACFAPYVLQNAGPERSA